MSCLSDRLVWLRPQWVWPRPSYMAMWVGFTLPLWAWLCPQLFCLQCDMSTPIAIHVIFLHISHRPRPLTYSWGLPCASQGGGPIELTVPIHSICVHSDTTFYVFYSRMTTPSPLFFNTTVQLRRHARTRPIHQSCLFMTCPDTYRLRIALHQDTSADP